MRLGWERRGVVRMSVKVEELAALVAGARVAAHALASQPGEQTAELERILGDFDRASRGLAGGAGTPGPDGFFQEGSRTMQERFGTTALADRIAEKFLKDYLDDGDRAFVQRADMFFLATADGQGRPSCSYKGGEPGFVTVVDEHTLAFPNYDGNGMFVSWGNTLANPEVGLLFIDFERGHRMRVHGTASIEEGDELLAAYPEAQFVVRVRVREVFPNCPRYIHRYRLVERSRYVPHTGRPTPVPDWKQEPWACDVLPASISATTERPAVKSQVRISRNRP